MVCLKGLNGEMEASQFTFQEPPLWYAAAPGKPASKLQLIEVDLSVMQSESVTIANQTPQSIPILSPPADTAEPSGNITAVINLQLMGAMKWLQEASHIDSASASQ